MSLAQGALAEGAAGWKPKRWAREQRSSNQAKAVTASQNWPGPGQLCYQSRDGCQRPWLLAGGWLLRLVRGFPC